MSDATKIPFEPIAMPPLGPMPPLSEASKAMFPEASKPSFSRSTTPPLPPTRKPLPMDEDAVPLTKFLPAGIAPEAPEPAKKSEAAPQSWLRRKRLKLAMSLASIGAAGYGLHEFAPNLKPEDPTAKPAEVAKPSTIPVAPKIAEERGLIPLERPNVTFERHDAPGLMPILSRNEEPAPFRLTAGIAPLSVPVMPLAISSPVAPVILPPAEPTAPPPVFDLNVTPEAPRTFTPPPPVRLETSTAPVIIVKQPELPPVVTAPLPLISIPIETNPVPTPFVPPVDVVTAPVLAPTTIPATSLMAVPVVPTKPTPVVVGEPKTDYDVDLHRVKSAETYATISEKYYGNAQYAAALKAYNRGAEVAQLREVQVPPMFVIRKMAPAPATPSEVVPAGVEENWNGVGTPKNTGEVRFETYRVPRTGMTMRDVAKAVYGSEREWQRVDNRRNIKYRPDEDLPVGAELQVPVERPDWR